MLCRSPSPRNPVTWARQTFSFSKLWKTSINFHKQREKENLDTVNITFLMLNSSEEKNKWQSWQEWVKQWGCRDLPIYAGEALHAWSECLVASAKIWIGFMAGLSPHCCIRSSSPSEDKALLLPRCLPTALHRLQQPGPKPMLKYVVLPRGLSFPSLVKINVSISLNLPVKFWPCFISKIGWCILSCSRNIN